ncbi:MAG: hemagglutinin [Actinomycetaceae bacterium]|nr:hemagglutinin [Actinomycetaceae bacterium]
MPDAASQSRLIYLIPFIVLGLLLALFVWAIKPNADEADEGVTAQVSGPQLDMEGFDPGYIVSDEVFFDSETMDQDQITEFIEKWNAGCVAGADGAPCLAQYVEDSTSWTADAFCPGDFVGEPGDSAPSIINKAAKACNVNPQVLLTVLQKEQGLITASGHNLSHDDYAIAMGYGCPDGGACDPKYMGFARQIYNAAHQFQMYRVQPHKYDVIAGRENSIAYNPDAECGRGEIFVQNQATAGLYNYTPYQPTEATVKGMPEECSSWGNMNFYGLFRAWFGDPLGR